MAADQDTIVEAGTVILVVDDSRVMRQALKKILSSAYPVAEAADGEEGWNRILEDPSVACVYTDLSMPRLDGYGLIRRIRESVDPRVRDIPVVLITGNEDSEGTRQRALSAGANSVVHKPFHAGDILEVARRHVEQWRSRSTTQARSERPDEGVALRQRVAELETTLRDLRIQLQGWQEEAQRVEASSQSAVAAWEETVDTLRLQLREAHEERDRLRKDHERLRTELILRQQSTDEKRVSERIRELEKQLAEERAQFSQAREENRKLAAELEFARSAVGETASQAEDLESRLQQVLGEQAHAREEVSRLRRDLEGARDENGGLEQSLGLERGRAAELQARVNELQAQVEGLREDAGQWSERLADTERELSEWQFRARDAEQALAKEREQSPGGDEDTLRRELEEARERAQEAEQTLALERERIHGLELEDRRLREELSGEQARARAAEQTLTALREEYGTLQEAQAALPDGDTVEVLRERAEAAELNQLQLENELVDMAARLERGDEARMLAESELRSLMQELADARRQLREHAALVATEAESASPGAEDVPTALDAVRTEPEETEGKTSREPDMPVDGGEDAGRDMHVDLDDDRQNDIEIDIWADEPSAGRGYGRDPLIRQWEEERRRQRRTQVIILVSVAAVAALGLYFLLR